MSGLSIRVLTAKQSLFEGEAVRVVVTTTTGQLTLLPGHAELLTLVGNGVLLIEQSEGEQRLCLLGGTLECRDDAVLILADRAQFVADIDVKRAEQEMAAAKVRLGQLTSLTHPEFATQQARLTRAQTRIEAAAERSS